jgi:hypothetical protein
MRHKEPSDDDTGELFFDVVFLLGLPVFIAVIRMGDWWYRPRPPSKSIHPAT